MRNIVIHHSPFGLFVSPCHSQPEAEDFRAACARDGQPCSAPVRLPHDIDCGALEQVLSFLDQLHTAPPETDSTVERVSVHDLTAAPTDLAPHFDAVLARLPELLARSLPDSGARHRIGATDHPRAVVNGGDLRFQQPHETLIEFDHPSGAGLIGIRPYPAGDLVIEVYASTGAVIVRHDPPRPRSRAQASDHPQCHDSALAAGTGVATVKSDAHRASGPATQPTSSPRGETDVFTYSITLTAVVEAQNPQAAFDKAHTTGLFTFDRAEIEQI